MKRTVIIRDVRGDYVPAAAEVSQIEKGPGVATSDVGRYIAQVESNQFGIGDTVEEACDNLAGGVDPRPTSKRSR